MREADNVLHGERIGPKRGKRLHDLPAFELPDGCFVLLGATPHLVWGGRFLAWSLGGYTGALHRSVSAGAILITPPSIVAALRAG